MIGLFPASVQTDVQHFAAKSCQTTVVEKGDLGITAKPDVKESGSTAEIR